MNNKINIDLIGKYRTPLMGVAMLWILLFHSPMKELELPFLLRFVKRTGFGGVDIFFLLSGLGIYFSYTKNSVKDFYLKRLVRIVPYCLPIFFLYGILFELPNDLLDVKGFIMRLCFVDYWKRGMVLGWFIPVLLMFYFITPLIFKVVDFTKKKHVFPFVILIAIAGWCVGYFLEYEGFMNVTIFRLIAYVLGLYLGYLVSSKKKIKLTSALIGLCTTFSLITLYFYALLVERGELESFFSPIQINFIIVYVRGISFAIFPFFLCTCLTKLFSKFPSYKFPILSFIGSYTLCIYIFHERILMVFWFYNYSHVALGAVVLAFIAAYFWQNFMNWVIRKVSWLPN